MWTAEDACDRPRVGRNDSLFRLAQGGSIDGYRSRDLLSDPEKSSVSGATTVYFLSEDLRPLRTDGIRSIDLTDDNYTVEQSLVRNKYKATDRTGQTVIRGKQKMLKMKEEFPFVDPQGNEVFTVKAAGVIDVAGNYAIIDSATGKK